MDDSGISCELVRVQLEIFLRPAATYLVDVGSEEFAANFTYVNRYRSDLNLVTQRGESFGACKSIGVDKSDELVLVSRSALRGGGRIQLYGVTKNRSPCSNCSAARSVLPQPVIDIAYATVLFVSILCIGQSSSGTKYSLGDERSVGEGSCSGLLAPSRRAPC